MLTKMRIFVFVAQRVHCFLQQLDAVQKALKKLSIRSRAQARLKFWHFVLQPIRKSACVTCWSETRAAK